MKSKLSKSLKKKVFAAVQEQLDKGVLPEELANTLGMNRTKFERLRMEEFDKIPDGDWLRMGATLNVNVHDKNWKVAKTFVYRNIDDGLRFCKEYSKSMMLVDECGIGKTFCAKQVIKTLDNAFYLDCSQGKNRYEFIKELAKSLGLNSVGKHQELKDHIKYYVSYLDKPLIILDEFGDLDYTTMLTVKELWNSLEGKCGWYIMGADGLRSKIERGIRNQKVGYAELFSRFADEFLTLTPLDPNEKKKFRINLLEGVAKVNGEHLSDQEIRALARKLAERNKTLRNLQTTIEIGR